MKKLTLLLAACSVVFMSYAAGGNITYELNGGVTNDHGWTNKQDMYDGLNTSWNTFKATSTVWIPLDTLLARHGLVNAVPAGIPTQSAAMDVPFIQDATVKAEWQWLVDYMDAACTAQGKALASSSGATLRYNFSAFFLNSVRPGWPASPDYGILGQPEAFFPAWKHGFASPATYDGTVKINLSTPYKEGWIFDGWFANADFSGPKITSIAVGEEGNKTLYAKWTDVPSCAQVKALGAGQTTKAGGIVTFINDKTVYVQDISGGLKVEFTTAPTIAVGDKITLTGTTAALGSYIEVTGATFLTKETATLPAIQTVLIPTLTADPAAYMFEYVYLEGLKIKSYGSGSVVLSDDLHDITLLATLNQSKFTVNTKVNLKATVSYDTKVILVADPANVTAAPTAGKDPAVYTPIVENGKTYSLTNRWLISNKMDNLSANPIGNSGFVRGMTAKNGKMYFADRELLQLTVVDGSTGMKLPPIKLAADVFMHDGVLVGYPNNDIKQDAAGNILVGSMITSNKGVFQIWKIDLATGAGTLIIDEVLFDNPDFAESSIRFDAFGVYGDVDNNAIIMAANALAMEAYKWTITNGVVVDVDVILINTLEEGTWLTGITNPGTAPQIFPMDEDYFYLDGNATLPTLIDMQGNVIDGFYNVPKGVEDWSTTIDRRQGHNGLIEFELDGEYYFLIASTNTVGVPPSAFRLLKFADGNKEFSEIKSMWELPKAGMGAGSNAYRTATPSVEVNETTKTATLYLYTGENGYGVYEFSVLSTGVKSINDNNAVGVYVNSRTLTLSKEVASVAVYSVAGQLVAKANNVSSVNVLSNGVFVVKATTHEGKTAIHKVIVK